jgi:membrane associated rhomboid family serine protease
MFFGGWSLFPPVIKGLLITNVVVWFLFDVLLVPFHRDEVFLRDILIRHLALFPLGKGFEPWQLLTYMFLHGGFWHVLFNMLALWMFGMELENTWGSRKFLLFYLVCGVGAGITHMFVAPLVGQGDPTVGASGAVFGVLVGFAMLFPNRPVYIYFLLPVKAKYLIIAWIGLELFYGVTGNTAVAGTGDGIAHFAHLGGAAVGFLFVAIESDLIPLRQWMVRFKGEDKYPFVGSNRIRPTVHTIHDATFHDVQNEQHSSSRGSEDEVTQEVVDEILDKISRDGYQSLTDDEKRILNEASKKIN